MFDFTTKYLFLLFFDQLKSQQFGCVLDRAKMTHISSKIPQDTFKKFIETPTKNYDERTQFSENCQSAACESTKKKSTLSQSLHCCIAVELCVHATTWIEHEWIIDQIFFEMMMGAESMSCEYCTGHKVDRRAPLSPLYSFVQKLIWCKARIGEEKWKEFRVETNFREFLKVFFVLFSVVVVVSRMRSSRVELLNDEKTREKRATAADGEYKLIFVSTSRVDRRWGWWFIHKIADEKILRVFFFSFLDSFYWIWLWS